MKGRHPQKQGEVSLDLSNTGLIVNGCFDKHLTAMCTKIKEAGSGNSFRVLTTPEPVAEVAGSGCVYRHTHSASLPACVKMEPSLQKKDSSGERTLPGKSEGKNSQLILHWL